MTDNEAQQDSPQALFEKGVEALAEGRLDDALPCFETVVEQAPTFAGGHYNLGICLSAFGEAGDALKAFEKASSLAPEHANSHLNAGKCLLMLGQPEGAIKLFDKATELGVDVGMAMLGKGIAYHQLDELTESRDCLAKIPEEHSNYGVAQYYIGDCLRREQNLEQAIPVLKAAQESNPQMPEVMESLFLAYYEAERHALALDMMEQLRKVDASAPGRYHELMQKAKDAITIPLVTLS